MSATAFNVFTIECRLFELNWPYYVNHLERRARLKEQPLSYSQWVKSREIIDAIDVFKLTGNWIVRAKLTWLDENSRCINDNTKFLTELQNTWLNFSRERESKLLSEHHEMMLRAQGQ